MPLLLLSLTALCVALPAFAAPQPPQQFRDGDVVALVGDSITHGRKWHRYLYNYYLTRFPERKVRFVNMGIAGDSAGGALRRLDWDILPSKPNVAVIFLGMNDVGRGYYAPNPTEALLKGRQTALDGYRANMDQLAQKLLAAGVKRLIFCTPSPYDDTGDLGENFPGVNTGLVECGRIGPELADKYGGSVVDLNGPMTALNLEHQKADPKFTIIGPDRVHPGDVGMMIIAYLFLKAQQAPREVSRVVVDGVAGEVGDTANATVADLKKTPEGLEFEVAAKALPWPLEASAKDALSLVPVVEDLNQEQLVVKLPPGTYKLSIDGVEVGEYTAEMLAAGLNLATNDQTPQYRQALQVWQTNEQRSGLEVSLRTMAQMRTVLQGKQVNEDDPAAVEACFTEFMARIGEGMRPYFTNQINVYKRTKADLPNLTAQLEALQQKLWELNQPVARRYRLVRVP